MIEGNTTAGFPASEVVEVASTESVCTYGMPRMAPHWYKVHISECPACGRSKTERERMYSAKPTKWEDRHESVYRYDYCLER